MAYLLLSPTPVTTDIPPPPTTPPPTHPTSLALAVVRNDNAGTDADDDNDDDDRDELPKSAGIRIDPFPPLLIPESALTASQLPMPLLPPPSSSPSLPLSPIFLLLSLFLPSSSLQPPPPPDLPLRSPLSLLRRNINPDLDLSLDLDLVFDSPKAAVPLDVFLPRIWGDVDLDTDTVLAFQEDPLITLLSWLSPPSLSPSLSPSLHLQQP